MHAPTKGTHARTRSIPADKLQYAIAFLESRLRDSEAQAAKLQSSARDYYHGRIDAFELAINELREVSR